MQINWLRQREREIWHGAPGYDFRLGKQKCVFPTKRTVHNNKTHLGPTRRGLTWAQLNFHILSHSSFVFLSFLRVRVPKYTKNKTNKTKLTVYDTICCASNCEINSEKRKKTEVSNGCQLSLLLDFGTEREGERQRERVICNKGALCYCIICHDESALFWTSDSYRIALIGHPDAQHR